METVDREGTERKVRKEKMKRGRKGRRNLNLGRPPPWREGCEDENNNNSRFDLTLIITTQLIASIVVLIY